MPTLICPHCQSPQTISDEVFQKNLGKKCRCKACQKGYTIEESAPPPAAEPEGFGDFDFLNDDSPAPPPAPVAPAKSKAVSKSVAKLKVPAPVPAPAPSPVDSDEPDFAAMMGGPESPAAMEFPDFHSPEPVSVPASAPPPVPEFNTPEPERARIDDAPEFPSFDEIPPPADSSEAALPSPEMQTQRAAPRESVDGVANLPDRPALKFIATILRGIGWVHFLAFVLAVLRVVFHLATAKSTGGGGGNMLELMILLGFMTSAVFWFALSELIHLALAMEARLYEISCRTPPRA